MEIRELRIGNYVLLDDEKLVKVIWVKYDSVCIIEIGKEYPHAIVNISRISGIPLTEKILLKFGFLYDDNFYHLNNIWISNFYENYFSLDGFDETKIEYIHQLQNLYFPLKGEELTFKKD